MPSLFRDKEYLLLEILYLYFYIFLYIILCTLFVIKYNFTNNYNKYTL